MPPTPKDSAFRNSNVPRRSGHTHDETNTKVGMKGGGSVLRSGRWSIALVLNCLAAAAFWSSRAVASENDMLILPTVVATEGDCVSPKRNVLPPDPSIVLMAKHVDTLLGDSVQDLDLSLEISPTARAADDEAKPPASDESLVSMAATRWVVSPRMMVQGSHVELRLVAVAPGSRVIASRSQAIDSSNVDVRAVVMLGELVRAYRKGPEASPAQPAPIEQPHAPAKSEGRGILAVSTALLGGFTGYWLQRASGSNDPRVTYPLAALGMGIGLGASMLAADEWDISVDDAWTLTAGIAWPTASGFLIARGRNVPVNDRYVYGLLGAGTGLTLASVSISMHNATPGGAVMVHSGGAFGLFLGALTEWTWRGSTESPPSTGMGVGAGIGVLAAGIAATQIDTTSTRVLFINLAASLGALSGAAVASGLLVADTGKLPLNQNRTWLVTVGSGTLLGGGVGWLLTRNMTSRSDEPRRSLNYYPYVGMSPVANSQSPTRGDGWVAGLAGTW